MKRFTLLLLLLCLSFVGFCQPTIKPEDASKYVGQTVTVCGKVFDGKYMDNIKSKPTLLNMGAAYPKELLTVVIWNDLRAKLGYKPEEKFAGKQLCITGKVTLYKNRLEIIVENASEIKG